MKISKKQFNRIIREEVDAVLREQGTVVRTNLPGGRLAALKKSLSMAEKREKKWREKSPGGISHKAALGWIKRLNADIAKAEAAPAPAPAPAAAPAAPAAAPAPAATRRPPETAVPRPRAQPAAPAPAAVTTRRAPETAVPRPRAQPVAPATKPVAQSPGQARRAARAAGELTYVWKGKKYGTRGSTETDIPAWKRKMARIRARRGK